MFKHFDMPGCDLVAGKVCLRRLSGEERNGSESPEQTASRFKEALTIYTDDKHLLLEAVRKSSHRPSATDLVKKEISESVSKAEVNNPTP